MPHIAFLSASITRKSGHERSNIEIVHNYLSHQSDFSLLRFFFFFFCFFSFFPFLLSPLRNASTSMPACRSTASASANLSSEDFLLFLGDGSEPANTNLTVSKDCVCLAGPTQAVAKLKKGFLRWFIRPCCKYNIALSHFDMWQTPKKSLSSWMFKSLSPQTHVLFM